MITVYIVNNGQRNVLVNRRIKRLAMWYFNPIQDIDDNWIISQEEIDQVDDINGVRFINSLQTKTFVPKPERLSINEVSINNRKK